MVHFTFIGQGIHFQCRLPDNTALASTCPSRGTKGCSAIAFETRFATSISSEWQLVCENAWMSPMTMTMYMVGVMAGAVVLGSASDKVRPVFVFVTMNANFSNNSSVLERKEGYLRVLLGSHNSRQCSLKSSRGTSWLIL